MKKKVRFFAALFTFVLGISSVAYAHQGTPLDVNGGHKDRLGYYHYHHGHEAHLHINGTCPYADKLTLFIPKNGVMPGTAVTAELKAIPSAMATPREIGISMIVNQVPIKGPFLLYNNTYYVPIYQLAEQLPITVTDDPASRRLTVSSENNELKSLYVDDYVVFLPSTQSEKYYHKFNCDILHQKGITNFYAFDYRLLDEATMGIAPCQYCIKK